MHAQTLIYAASFPFAQDHVDHSWKQTLKALDEEEAEADAVVKHMKQSPSLPKKASTAA